MLQIYKLQGLSTDSKPSLADLATGSTFTELDTGNVYVFNAVQNNWLLQSTTTRVEATAVGIRDIRKTSTKDNVDTYTIYYTSGASTTFTVTNGLNGTAGKDGADGTNIEVGDGLQKTGDVVEIDDKIVATWNKLTANQSGDPDQVLSTILLNDTLYYVGDGVGVGLEKVELTEDNTFIFTLADGTQLTCDASTITNPLYECIADLSENISDIQSTLTPLEYDWDSENLNINSGVTIGTVSPYETTDVAKTLYVANLATTRSDYGGNYGHDYLEVQSPLKASTISASTISASTISTSHLTIGDLTLDIDSGPSCSIGIKVGSDDIRALFNRSMESYGNSALGFGTSALNNLLPAINAPATGLVSAVNHQFDWVQPSKSKTVANDTVELEVNLGYGDLRGIGAIFTNDTTAEHVIGPVISQVCSEGISELIFTKVNDVPKLVFCANAKLPSLNYATAKAQYREVATIGAGTIFTGEEQVMLNPGSILTASLGTIACFLDRYDSSEFIHLTSDGKVEDTATLYKSNSNTFGLLDPTVCLHSTGTIGFNAIKTVSALYHDPKVTNYNCRTDVLTFADSLLRTEYILNGPENPWYLEEYAELTQAGNGWSNLISSYLKKFPDQAKELTDYQQSLFSLRVLSRALSITPKTEAFVKTDAVTESTDFSEHAYYKYVPSNASNNNDWGYVYATEYDSEETYYIKDISRLTLANVDLAKLMIAQDDTKPSDRFNLCYYMCNWLGQRLLALLHNNVTLKVAVGGNTFCKYSADYKYKSHYSVKMSATTYLSCSRYQILQLPDTQEARQDAAKTKLNLSNNVLVMYFDYRPSELMLPLYGIQESFNRLTDYDPADNAVFGNLIEQSLDNYMDTVKTMALYIRLYNDNTLDD